MASSQTERVAAFLDATKRELFEIRPSQIRALLGRLALATNSLQKSQNKFADWEDIFALIHEVAVCRAHSMFLQGMELLREDEQVDCRDLAIAVTAESDQLPRPDELFSRCALQSGDELWKFLLELLRDAAMKDAILRHWRRDALHIASDTMRMYSHGLLAHPLLSK